MTADDTIFVIDRLGGLGHGIAETPEGPVFVPLTLPGDKIRVRLENKRGDGRAARLIEVLEPGPDRVSPPCAHFGDCGGCALQHLDPARENAWKQELVAEVLARRGFSGIAVGETVSLPIASRRRTTLKAVRAGGRLIVGYNQRASHQIAAVASCAVLSPELGKLIPAAVELAARLKLPKRGLSLDLTASSSGVDLVVGARGEPNLDLRQWLSEFAESHDLARISWGERDPEAVVVRRNPVVNFGEIAVEIPPGGFLQASVAAEEVLAGMVGGHLDGCKQVADLYAGVGTFALTLAASGIRVSALDGDEAAVGALQGAVNRRAGRLSATAEVRDLEQRPLSVKELSAFDGVVLDPPRAGAASQCQALAGSLVGRIAYVSCHPGSFARDARTLVDGGYSLTGVTPVNQFPFSHHIELVGTFER